MLGMISVHAIIHEDCFGVAQVIQKLKGHEDKVRVVLNKADTVASQSELMRVYGALLWSLGKVLRTPEVVRVYVLSLWDKKKPSPWIDLHKSEEHELMKELQELPRNAAMAKVSHSIHTVLAWCWPEKNV